jgi:hypothetical protein
MLKAMRSLLVLCVVAAALIAICKPAQRHAELSYTPVSTQSAAPQQPESGLEVEAVSPQPKPSLLSLLTLGTAVLGAVSTAAAESPLDANAQLAARIVETTAQLEASSARVADARAR